MIRAWLWLSVSAVVGGTASTQPPTPSAPSLTGTVTYTAGGSTHVTGSQGYWFIASSGQTPSVKVVGFAVAQAGTDSLHPSVDGLELAFAGARFATVPLPVSMPIGAANGASLGIDALSSGAGAGYFAADSGSASVRPLGGGYVRADLK